MKTLIRNAVIVDGGHSLPGSVLIEDELILDMFGTPFPDPDLTGIVGKVIDAEGMLLIPGVIDDQVHFREPGATHKGDIAGESAAALLGGVTSFMDMPNNNPPVCTLEALESKYSRAAEVSSVNYSFYLGAVNGNTCEIRSADPSRICGVKVFMGSSTGNMLVDDTATLESIFRESPMPVATHCEKEEIIRANLAEYIAGGDIPFSAHPLIRSREACMLSTSMAIAAAVKYGTRLHVLHVSTAEELEMLSAAADLTDGRITSEVCVHYMWFDDSMYDALGARMKCNPAIKTARDRKAIIDAVAASRVNAVATDHAPHLLSEKEADYLHAPSGLPLVQHSLQMMMELSERGHFPVEQVVKMMCHYPAECFNVSRRGYIRKGYYADLVLLRRKKYTVSRDNIAYKCGWSPLEGTGFSWTVDSVFVNGTLSVRGGERTGRVLARRLEFDR